MKSICRRVANMMSFVSNRLENIVDKERNAGYQHFLLFSQFFQDFPFWDHQPFPKQQILYASKLKDIADANFRFDENGRQFFPGASKGVIVWEWVKSFNDPEIGRF